MIVTDIFKKILDTIINFNINKYFIGCIVDYERSQTKEAAV